MLGGELIVNTNENGDLYSINGEVSSGLSLQTQPAIDSEQARQTALQSMAEWYEKTPADFVASEPGLWIYDESLLRPSTRPAELVWRMEVTAKDVDMLVRELVLINAQRGNISLHFNQVDTAWTLQGSAGAIQEPDPTPTPLATETPLPTETPVQIETLPPTETPEAEATTSPMEGITPTEEAVNVDPLKGGVTSLTGATWYVATTGNDSNSCSSPAAPCLTINSAIYKAANGDGVLVAGGTYGPVRVTKSVSILGGWDSTFSSQIGTSTVDGNVSNHGIYASAPNISFSRFMVQNSNFGIQHTAGTLGFERGALIHNNIGIYNSGGEATLTNTTISGNDAEDMHGYRYAGSAIMNVGGVVRIRYATITGNTGNYAIHNANSSAHVEIGNSILAGNEVGDCYIDSNSMISAGNNILGNSAACSGPKGFVPDPMDQLGVDPHLLSLLRMGYDPISSISPAIDSADPITCPATDQRGVARPQGSACDIGAYEYIAPGAPAAFGILSGSEQHSGSSLPFPLPLVVYVIDAFGSPVGGVNVIFTAPASGPSGTFADTGTNTTTIVTNEAGLATSPIFTANAQLGAYNVTATVPGLTGSMSFALVNATWFVSPTGSDGNSCNVHTSPCLTINAAINKAANGDSILVAEGTYPAVRIPKILTLLGGWDSTFSSQIGFSTVDGNFTSHGLTIDGQDVSMSRFIVQNSVFGIYHSGTGILRFDRGASINNNNGLYNYSGETIFTNTTISGNHAGDTQGYVYSGSAISIIHGGVKIQSSTIVNNGGTEAISLVQLNAYLEIGNSILAGNPRWDCDGEKTMTSLGHNIFGSSPPCQHPGSVFVPHPTDQVGVDPKLGALFPSGYHPLLSDSPAIDAANPLDCPAVDQRGAARPAGTSCDIGAVEFNVTATAPRHIFAYEGAPQIIVTNSPASSRLIAIAFDEDGDQVQGKTVTFTAPDHGASVIFADTGTNTATAVTDVNGFAISPAFSANSSSGSYFIVATVNGASTPARFSLSNSTLALNSQVQTYTANNFISLPGTFLCNQTKPGCTNGFDVHADAAHKYAIGTYALYGIEHARNSINDAGMTTVSSVHYSDTYANAVWTGYQMVYGDTYDFPLADDVVAHELTHGVTQYESNLFYYYQSGAINESFADLWGEYYDQTNGMGNDTVSVKWLVGEDVSDLRAIRNMSNPPAFGDPDKMSSLNYYTGKGDGGGVHTNSGINNKAIFLMVDGGSFNGKTVAALGWQKTAAIYYEVNTNLLSSGADYSDLYYALQQACSNLIGQKGITSGDCTEVKNVVDAVEMNGQPTADFNTDAPYCDMGTAITTVFADDLESGTGNWTLDNGAYVRWQFDSPYGSYAHSGNHSLYADDYPANVTDASAQLTSVTVPPNAYLRFAHAYDFEAYEASGYYDDGGVLEYSVNGGTTWNDAEPLIDFNGYKGTIRTGMGGNPLQGRSAFAGSSHGYISTRLNLASLAGETVSFRWRMGLDISGYAWGWWVDDVQVYTCGDTPATLLSPSGDIGTNYTPTYSWNKVSDASWYYLWVSRLNDNGSLTTIHNQWYETSAVCGSTTCSVTPRIALTGGNYRWWVQTWNSGGYGPWSAAKNFSTTVLGAATLVSPDNDIGTNYNPTYTWNKVSVATWYYLWVSKVNADGSLATIHNNWYDASQVCGSTACSFTPNVPLPGGNYRWWIQTWNQGGYGPWSSGMDFRTSPPGPATLVSPTGAITDTTPDYAWNTVAGATWYYLWISKVNADGSLTTVHAKWYPASGDPILACNSSTCSITPAGITLTSGSYRWWVQTWNDGGYGPWSGAANFSTP